MILNADEGIRVWNCHSPWQIFLKCSHKFSCKIERLLKRKDLKKLKNFKVEKELMDYLEANMNKAKVQRDSIEDEKSELYIFSQGALDEARKVYFELFVKY